MANSEIILSSNTHPGDSTVETVTGSKFKGDGFYGRSDGLHTVQYSLNGFQGTIIIEATLASDPQEEDWFIVYSQNYELSGSLPGNSQQNESHIENFTGNYVWIRARLEDWSDGTVNFIKLNH